MMGPHNRRFAIAIAAVFGLLPAGATRAQWYSSYPRQAQSYGYGVPLQQPYAVEVAPNTYVIRHPLAARDDARVICVKDCGDDPQHRIRRRHAERHARKSDRPHKPADRALIEELRKRSGAKRHTERSVKVVRDKPVVIVHKHVVNDPPRVIERRHIVEDVPPSDRGLFQQRQVVDVDPPLPPSDPAPVKPVKKMRRARIDPDPKRVIHAEAEVTILGPDRMSIRLYRKRGSGGDANAKTRMQ
jgi:hypothetical protein